MLLQIALDDIVRDIEQLKATRKAAGLPPCRNCPAKAVIEKKPGDRLRSCLVSWKRTNPWNKFPIVMAIDNGSIASVQAYPIGDMHRADPSEVRFAPPEVGDEYETAQAGYPDYQWRRFPRIDLVNRGFGYNKVSPFVTISPPAA
jgi:hypothetical protein